MNTYSFDNDYLDRIKLEEVANFYQEDDLENLFPHRLTIEYNNGPSTIYYYYKRQHRNNDFRRLQLKKEKLNDNQ